MPTKKWAEANKERQLKNQRDWYARNKEKAKRWVDERSKKTLAWFTEYKSHLKCQTCNESHPACLDFHHIDAKEKEINVSKAVDYNWSKQRILTEIAKCSVLCSNCHRKLHWQEKLSKI